MGRFMGNDSGSQIGGCMKTTIRMLVVAAGLLAPVGLMAQAPAGAPAGATGQCQDGTYSTAANKQGACRGHQGVKDWYAAGPAAAPAAKTAPAAAKSAPAAMPAPTAAKTPTVAAGGGPGMVWVNPATKVYHCPGTQYYGTTKEGKYMSEADAKAMGAHADHNRPCTK
jgi:Protein of unknown function (DUF3761)